MVFEHRTSKDVFLVEFLSKIDYLHRGFLRGFVPFIAVASAGIVNVLMIRQNELTKGIAVFDQYVV